MTRSYLQMHQLSLVVAPLQLGQSSHSFSNSVLAPSALLSLPSSLALSEWLNLLQLQPLSSLVFFFFFPCCCPGNTQLFTGPQTHRKVSHFRLCSLSCPCLKHPSLQDPLCKFLGVFENSALFSFLLPLCPVQTQPLSGRSLDVYHAVSRGHLLVYMARL